MRITKKAEAQRAEVYTAMKAEGRWGGAKCWEYGLACLYGEKGWAIQRYEGATRACAACFGLEGRTEPYPPVFYTTGGPSEESAKEFGAKMKAGRKKALALA